MSGASKMRRINKNLSDYRDGREYHTSSSTSIQDEFTTYCPTKKCDCKFILVKTDQLNGEEYKGTGCSLACSRRRS